MARVKQIKLDVDNYYPTENLLKDYAPITKIGILAPPGSIFQLNEGNDIEMGQYGIYELDITNLGYIDSLVIKSNSEKESKPILVDFVYHGEGPDAPTGPQVIYDGGRV